MKIEKLVKKILGISTPIVKFINKYVNMPFSKKNITGDHYYLWRDKFIKGSVFLTDINGEGTNIINVSKLNHGAIYFGKGLRTYIDAFINSNSNYTELKKRLTYIRDKYKVSDNICYVIESVSDGVIPTNLVKFMTTKDVLLCVKPRFCDESAMALASKFAVFDLGLEYDYKFSENDNRRYCFELVGRSYENACSVKLDRKVFKLFGVEVYSALLSDSFTDHNWDIVIDSRMY